MSSVRIKQVKDNKDKQETYRSLNKKLTDAYKNNNYESVLLLSYAMIEDRLLSMLHYLYLIEDRNNKPHPSDLVDKIIRPILGFKEDSNKQDVYRIYNISTKIKLLKLVIEKSNYDYLNDCNRIIDYMIGLDKYHKFFKDLEKWLKLRNEIIHASFNKNIDDLNDKLKLASIEGYRLSNIIKKYVNKLKSSIDVLSVRDKWSSIEKIEKEENYNDLYKMFGDIEVENEEMEKLYKFDIIKPNILEYGGLSIEDIFEETKLSPTFNYFTHSYFYDATDEYGKDSIFHRFIISNVDKLYVHKHVRALLCNPFDKIHTQIYVTYYFKYLTELLKEHPIIIESESLDLSKYIRDVLLYLPNNHDSIINEYDNFLTSIIENFDEFSNIRNLIFNLPVIVNDFDNLRTKIWKKFDNTYTHNMIKIIGDKIWIYYQYYGDDKEKIIELINNDHTFYFIDTVRDELRNDKDIVLAAIRAKAELLYYVSDRLKDDKEVVLEAVNKNGCLLEIASNRLKNDREVVIAAIKQDQFARFYIGDELIKDKEFIEEVKKVCPDYNFNNEDD